jgi:hypothetical protein
MNLSKTINLCFLLISLAGLLKCTTLHIEILTSIPTDPISGEELLEWGRFIGIIVIGAAAHTCKKSFNSDQNGLKEILQFCPAWIKLSICCLWIYGVIVGLSDFLLSVLSGFTMGNDDYWWVRQSSGGLIVIYGTTAAIFYTAVRRDMLEG